MVGPDSKEFFSIVESHIFLVALCLFLLIGAARLIMEEFIALVLLWYKLVAIVRKKRIPSSCNSETISPLPKPEKIETTERVIVSH
jgi:hypothetical protein